jgi:hypothetical protein
MEEICEHSRDGVYVGTASELSLIAFGEQGRISSTQLMQLHLLGYLDFQWQQTPRVFTVRMLACLRRERPDYAKYKGEVNTTSPSCEKEGEIV